MPTLEAGVYPPLNTKESREISEDKDKNAKADGKRI